MHLEDIYNKIFNGDHVTDEELTYFIKAAKQVIPVLTELGPVYRTANVDLSSMKSKAESALEARTKSRNGSIDWIASL